jgi:hypothetical protein
VRNGLQWFAKLEAIVLEHLDPVRVFLQVNVMVPALPRHSMRHEYKVGLCIVKRTKDERRTKDESVPQ